MRNNNRQIIALLAKESYRNNKRRNRILTAAVAFVVLMLFSVFSLAAGKIEADCLLYTRNAGTAASTTLEYPTEEQRREIDALEYIKATGEMVYLGYTDAFGCVVLDEMAYEKMQVPAFTDIHGKYPQKAEEVMLPIRALEFMGIEKPELGMEIPLEISLINEENLKQTFRLCGYYTEYKNSMEGLPQGYFSRSFMEFLDMDTELFTTLLIQQKDTVTDEVIEKKLYQDVTMRDDSQQFLGGNAMSYQAVFDLAGGYDTAILMCAVILTGAYLLIHNVMHISLNRDIQQFGLLKTLGTTRAQLRRIVYLQTARIVLIGCIAGGAAGIVITVTAVPKLLSDMYLHGFGDASAVIAFKPWILILAVIFGAGVTFFSTSFAMYKVVKLSPVEAVRFLEYTGEKQKKILKSTSGGNTVSMAWRNLFRFKRRFFVTVFSLFLGIVMALGAVVISKGTDQTNEINYENKDFRILNLISCMQADLYDKEEELFDPDLKDRILALEGITDAEVVHGGFGQISTEEPVLAIRFPEQKKWKSQNMVVQAVSDAYLDELDAFAREENLYIDTETVRKGEGVILLHYHLLSQIETEKSKETIGMPIAIYDMDNEKQQDMIFGGYLDFKKKGLPKLRTTWNGPDIIYFLASEEGFRKMGLTDQTFSIELDVEDKKEPLLKNTLNRMIKEYNQRVQRPQTENMSEEDLASNMKVLDFTAKSDIMENAKNYIVSSRIVMGALCTILIFMGLANYVNVTMTGLELRRKEFAVMESIGMTRKQLRKMILLEGVFCSSIVGITTVLLGSGILAVLSHIMHKRIAYFVFQYPLLELLLCMVILFFICIVIPLVMYKKTTEESVIERLRLSSS